MMPVQQQTAPQAPPPPVDADRLSQQINEQVQKALQQSLGKTDAAAPTPDQIRENIRAAIEGVREAAQAQQGRTFTTQAPPFDPSNMIPPQAVDISLAFFAMIAFIVVGLPLARAIARRMDRRGQTTPASEVTPRLDRIEQAIDAVAIEVERISENQRYSTKVIAELRGLPSASPAGWQGGREAEPVAREGAESRRP